MSLSAAEKSSPAPGAWTETKHGGVLTSLPIVLAKDVFFCCCGSSIRVHSLQTGDLLRTLEGHTLDVTSICLAPENHLRLHSFSLDGTMRIWDYSDGSLLITQEVGFPVQLAAPMPKDNKSFVLVSEGRRLAGHESEPPRRSNTVTKIVRWDSQLKQPTLLFKVPLVSSLAVSGRGEMVAAASKRRLYIWNATDNKVKRHKNKQKIVTMQFHPKELQLATGEDNGNITLWQKLATDAPVTSNKHWHPHICRALQFTPDGAYLLSGGNEAVLVIWGLETGSKNFLPRLGLSAISSIAISPDSTTYAVSCHDNSIRFINSFSLAVESVFQGLKNARIQEEWRPAVGLLVEPRSGSAVLNGYQGTASLQFYDIHRDHHILDLETESQTTLVRGEHHELRVEAAAFSTDGATLVTVDRFHALDREGDMSLKFWQRTNSGGIHYTLNTRVDQPHRLRITGVAFHPKENMVVTVSEDKKFKVWTASRPPKSATPSTASSSSSAPSTAVTPAEANTSLSSPGGSAPNTPQQPQGAAVWSCRSVGFYRDEAATCVAFSPDGSLLAVGYGATLTLWEPQLNILKHVLTHAHPMDRLRKVAFVPHSTFIVGYTTTHLIVWNLLTCTVWWSHKAYVTSLTVDPHAPRFAVSLGHDARSRDYLVVFEPPSPRPIYVALMPEDIRIHAMTYLPAPGTNISKATRSSTGGTSLLYLTSRQEMFLLEPPQQTLDTDVEDDSDLQRVAAALPGSPKAIKRLTSRRGPGPVIEAMPEGKDKTIATSATAVPSPAAAAAASGAQQQQPGAFDDIFNGPSHAIAPLSRLYESFMDRLLTKAQAPEELVQPTAPITSLSASQQSTTAESSSAAAQPPPSEPSAGALTDIPSFELDHFVQFFEKQVQAGGDDQKKSKEAKTKKKEKEVVAAEPPRSPRGAKEKKETTEAPAATPATANKKKKAEKTPSKTEEPKAADTESSSVETKEAKTPSRHASKKAAETPAAAATERTKSPRRGKRADEKAGQESSSQAQADESAKTPGRSKRSKATDVAKEKAPAALEQTPRRSSRRKDKDDESVTDSAAAPEKTPSAKAKTPKRKGDTEGAVSDTPRDRSKRKKGSSQE